MERSRAYGIAGKAAGEAALEHGRDGARIRSCTDAFVLSRIARAVVDALADDERGAVAASGILMRALGTIGRAIPGDDPLHAVIREAIDTANAKLRGQ